MSSVSKSTSTSSATSHGWSGLVSNMDTETMVEKLLSGTQSKIDKQKQSKQLLTWKQDVYRDIITSVNSFKSKYLTFGSSSANNLNSSSFFNSMNATSSSSAVKVTAKTTAPTGKVTIDSITQLATYRTLKAANTATGKMEGTLDVAALKSKTVTVKLGDVEKSFDISGLTQTNVASELNSMFANDTTGFGANKVTASFDSAGKLVISSVAVDGTKPAITIGGSDIGLNMLGLTAGLRSTGQTSGTVDFSKGTDEYLAKNPLSVNMTLDGVTKKITLDINAASDADFVTNFNNSLQSAFGNGVTASYDSGTDKISINTTNSSRQIIIAGSDATTAAFGMKNGQSNKMNVTQSLSDIKFANATITKDTTEGSTEDYKFTINGVEFTGKADKTLYSLMSEINSSDAGVKITYSSLDDKFTIASTSSGAGQTIAMSDTKGSVLTALFGNAGGTIETVTVEEGQNAKLSINGTSVERNNNSFEYDGLQIDLQAESTSAINITTTRDTDKIYKGIKSFVDDYNALIEKLNGVIDEEAKCKDYPPLTDAQKKEMSESEIELWEKKAKTGILRHDSDISSFLSQMRSALYTKATDGKYALYDLGITTGDWKDKGKLTIEDPPTKLLAALENDAQEVSKLFTDSTSGLATKLSNIIDDTAKVSSGDPGTLVRMAGSTGKTDTASTIYKQLKEISERLEKLDDQYDDERSRYWKQFNTMEQLLSSMNQQSSWLSSQFS